MLFDLRVLTVLHAACDDPVYGMHDFLHHHQLYSLFLYSLFLYELVRLVEIICAQGYSSLGFVRSDTGISTALRSASL